MYYMLYCVCNCVFDSVLAGAMSHVRWVCSFTSRSMLLMANRPDVLAPALHSENCLITDVMPSPLVCSSSSSSSSSSGSSSSSSRTVGPWI